MPNGYPVYSKFMTLKLFFYISVLLLAFLGYRNYSSPSSQLRIGDDAPSFSLNDAQGKTHYLSDYAGKYLVLYFYPKDNTPICTKEACNFRDNISQFEKIGATVLGVSVDDNESHASFAKKNNLSFPLLSDHDGKVARSYNALTDFYFVKVSKRYTFLISPASKVAKIYKSVDTSSHSQQIIDDIKLIQGNK